MRYYLCLPKIPYPSNPVIIERTWVRGVGFATSWQRGQVIDQHKGTFFADSAQRAFAEWVGEGLNRSREVQFSLFLAGFSGASTVATELYVSATGNDDNPGTKAEPLASLDAARDAARNLVGKGVVTVWIRGGLYERGACFELGKQDSGAEGAPVVYRAYEDESVRFSGGRRLPAEAFATVTDPAVL